MTYAFTLRLDGFGIHNRVQKYTRSSASIGFTRRPVLKQSYGQLRTTVKFSVFNDRLNVQAYNLIPSRVAFYKSYMPSMDECRTRLVFENYDFRY